MQIGGTIGRTRVVGALTYITTEIHWAYKPMWHAGSAAEKAKVGDTVLRLMQPPSDRLRGDYLFGPKPSVADRDRFCQT